MTSHELLEDAGLIHQRDDATSQSETGHDAADGLYQIPDAGYLAPTGHYAVTQIVLFWMEAASEVAITPAGINDLFNASPPDLPDLFSSWQFSLRTALPARAPTAS